MCHIKNMLKIIHILSCWKEIICIEYAHFVEYDIFVKSLMVRCFGCHGYMSWGNSFVKLILVLIIRCWFYNLCMNYQFDPLFREIIYCEYALFVKSLIM